MRKGGLFGQKRLPSANTTKIDFHGGASTKIFDKTWLNSTSHSFQFEIDGLSHSKKGSFIQS